MTQKKLRITVGGKPYDVLVEILEETGAPAPAPVTRPSPVVVAPPPVAAPRPMPTAVAGAITAPLAGIVVSVDVQVGDKVAANQQVVTLEAMKMQTGIHASADGVVQEVFVKRGDTVTEGQALLKIG